GIGPRALDDIHLNALHASLLDLPITHTSLDTERAARLLVDMGVGCIITLGGDGTNRLVARASGEVPLTAVSTGTNNVFPSMGEGGQKVLAPIAPGLLASVAVAEYRVLGPGDAVSLCQPRPCTLALDGEREHALPGGSEVCIRLNADGPRVVDVTQAIALASQ